MIKNMKLAYKMACGFGGLVLLAGVLGLAGWIGLGRVNDNVVTLAETHLCQNYLNDCAKFRRDFAITGFEKAPGETKDAAEKWGDSFAQLEMALQKLADHEGLEKEHRALIAAAQNDARLYQAAFEKLTAVQKSKEDSFAALVRTGGEAVKDLDDLMKKTVDPQLVNAIQSKNIDELAKWQHLDGELSDSVISPFLLLRLGAAIMAKSEKDEDIKNYQERLIKFKEGVTRWAGLAKGNGALDKAVTLVQEVARQYEINGAKFHDAVRSGQTAGAEMAARAKAIVDNMAKLSASIEDRVKSVTSWTDKLLLVLALSVIIIGVLLAGVITRSITGPLNVAITGISQGSEQIAAASTQVAQGSQQIAEGASEQASSLEEISSSLEEMSSMTRQNADNAHQASIAATEARISAEKGGEVMARMSSAIDKIQASSSQTAKILKTIDEIAFQTNLLALNAAVEAARAGEAGKGFAVVAEEVRSLAQRSAEAAKSTAALIEESQKNAGGGVAVSHEVETILRQISQGVQNMTHLIDDVSSASREQAQGIEQINTAVAQMDKVTQANAANAEESASAGEELSAQTNELKDSVQVLIAIVQGN